VPPVMSQMRILKFISLQSHIQNVGSCACVIHGVALLAGQGIDSIIQIGIFHRPPGYPALNRILQDREVVSQKDVGSRQSPIHHTSAPLMGIWRTFIAFMPGSHPGKMLIGPQPIHYIPAPWLWRRRHWLLLSCLMLQEQRLCCTKQ